MTTPRATHPPRPGLEPLVDALHQAVRDLRTPDETAGDVADVLRMHLLGPEVLTEAELRGDPHAYTQHVLYVDPDGAFSVVALVWLPGQETPIHDHVSWCVVGVVQGSECEIVYALREDADGVYLVPTGTGVNAVGSVCAFAPPGDIHLVRNEGPGVALSIHVYGADISRLGSSIRRTYRHPVRATA